MEDVYDLSSRKIMAERNGQKMLCPKCKDALILVYNRDVEVDACLKCKGIWVDVIEEMQLLNVKPEVFSIDELKRLRALYKPSEKVEKMTYVPCPVCQELMYRKNWGTHSGVMVDKCLRHGTWYDAGEFQKIEEFIALGGIEYEKFQFTEQGLNALDLKLMRKTHQLNKEINSAYMKARLYSLLGL